MVLGIVQPRWVESQGHHTNQAYYKLGIISPEYRQKLLSPLTKPQDILKLH